MCKLKLVKRASTYFGALFLVSPIIKWLCCKLNLDGFIKVIAITIESHPHSVLNEPLV